MTKDSYKKVLEFAKELQNTSRNGMELSAAKSIVTAIQYHDIEGIKFQLNKLSAPQAQELLDELEQDNKKQIKE